MPRTDAQKARRRANRQRKSGARPSPNRVNPPTPGARRRLSRPVANAIVYGKQTSKAETHPFLRCLMGPPNMAGPGVGFPDGSSAPALTIDYRQTMTIAPVGGVIRFALISSPYGTLALQCGSVNSARPSYLTTTDLTYQWLAAGTQTLNVANWYVLPNNEVVAAASAPAAAPFGPYSTTQYRGLMYTADVYFTGSSMQNGGVAKVYRTNVSATELAQINVNTTAVNSTEYTDLNTGIGSATGTVVSAARSTLNLRSVAAQPRYIPVCENLSTVNINALGRSSAGGTTPFVWCGLDTNVPVTVVEYTGLDATASITVEMRSCLEQMVAPGAMSGLAKPSPISDIGIWQKTANFARSIPAARVITAAASGYLSGGPIAALTGAMGALSV